MRLWKFGGVVGDDRGKVFDLDVSDEAWANEFGFDGDEEVLEIARRKASLISPATRVDIAWVVIAAVVLLPVVLVIVWVTTALKLNSWVGMAVIGCVTVSSYHAVRARVMREKTIRARIALLTYYRRCPQCVSRLDGLLVDETDGCVMCPECACSWKVSRFGGDEVLRELRESVLRLKGAAVKVGAGGTIDASVEKTADPMVGWLRRRFVPGMAVKDGRGRVVKLCRADLMDVPREHREAVEAERRARVLEAAGTWKRRWVHGVAGILITTLSTLAQYKSVSSPPTLLPGSTPMEIGEKLLRIAGFVFALVFFGGWTLRAFLRSRPLVKEQFVRSMVGEGLCPSCAAKLGPMRRDEEADAAEAEDKSDVKWVHDCPKCRAVWGVNG